MEWVSAFKDYVPLFQTIIWAFLIIFGFIFFRRRLGTILESVRRRIEGASEGGSIEVNIAGSSIKIGPYLKPINAQSAVNSQSSDSKGDEIVGSWTAIRNQTYTRNRDIFLVHVLAPSKKPKQKFDVFMFLIKHDGIASAKDAEIDRAEFFLGQGWGDHIFRVENEGGPIGLSTSAFGPFLAICQVTFKDGHSVIIDRYIDFASEKDHAEGNGV